MDTKKEDEIAVFFARIYILIGTLVGFLVLQSLFLVLVTFVWLLDISPEDVWNWYNNILGSPVTTGILSLAGLLGVTIPLIVVPFRRLFRHIYYSKIQNSLNTSIDD